MKPILLFLLILSLGGNLEPLGIQTAGAQEKPPEKNKKEAAEKKKKEDELKPRLEQITNKDGLQFACGVFPSDKGKLAVPVILIHEWNGQAPPYLPLAIALRDAGCYVVTPDLRGHGQSKTYVDAAGQTRPFDVTKMNRLDLQAIVSRDIEGIKNFLKAQNDAEKLNLNALTLIGVGEGGVLAAQYAALDWNFPDAGNKKQSKDVRAVILISPEGNVQGMNYDAATRHPFVSRLAWQIIAGKRTDQGETADKLAKQIDRTRRGAQGGGLDLFLVNSTASGPQLVRESREVIPRIVEFVRLNVIGGQEQFFPWVSRKGE